MSDPLKDKKPSLGSNPPADNDEKPRTTGGLEPQANLNVALFRNKVWVLSIILAIVTIASMVFAWWNLANWFSTIVVAVLGAGVVLFLLWKVPKWQVRPYRDVLQPKDRVELEIQARATLIQIIGGVAVLASIYLTAQNLRLTAQNVQTTENNLKYARSTQIAERYAKAIEQLKSKDDLGVRLAGIYTLGILASQEEAKDFREPIMRVLAAHVKNVSRLPEDYDPENDRLESVTPDIQAILTIIGQQKDPALKLNLHRTNLSNADFQDGHFENVDFGESYLGRAHFERAYLELADFSEADLTESSFEGAYLKKAKLVGARLISTSFKGAHLESSKLNLATIQQATFDNADLQEADFSEARGSGWFKDVNLNAALNHNLIEVIQR
jgi:uncharacterized protein YjbI with pentapeptide repeats